MRMGSAGILVRAATLLGAAAAAGTLLTACATGDHPGGSSPGPGASSPMSTTGLIGTWTLATARDADGAIDRGTAPVTISLTKTTNGYGLDGTAQVNGFGGTARIDGGSIRFVDVVSTQMASTDEALNAAERRYLTGISAVTRWRRSGDTLVLDGPGIEFRYVLDSLKTPQG